MQRTAKIFRSAPDGKRHIAVDKENVAVIMQFLRDNNLSKKFDLICATILAGLKNTDLYDKEDINSKCKNVTTMKFKGKQNARIYCQEVKQKRQNTGYNYIRIVAEEKESEKQRKRDESN